MRHQQGGRKLDILRITYLVTLINIALLFVLFYLYGDIYSKVHARFTLGLMLFAGILLLQNVAFATAIIPVLEFTPHASFGVTLAIGGFTVMSYSYNPFFALIPAILETAALSVLVYLTWE